MDRTPFDLLALPQVALLNVFSLMRPTQLLKMSRTSELSKHLIQSIKFDTALRTHGKNILVWYADDRDFKSVQLTPGYMPINDNEWRESVSEITRLYGTSVFNLDLYTNYFDDYWKWIKKEQSGLKYLTVIWTQKEDPQRIIRMLLDNSELTKLEELDFTIDIYRPLCFEFEFTDPFIFKSPPKSLRIGISPWFTVQHLMDSRAENIHLNEQKFTDEEINFILKQWVNKVDCLSNLKQLTMFRGGNVRTNFDVVLNGFQRENQRVDDGYTCFRIRCGEDFYLKVSEESPGCLDVLKYPLLDN